MLRPIPQWSTDFVYHGGISSTLESIRVMYLLAQHVGDCHVSMDLYPKLENIFFWRGAQKEPTTGDAHRLNVDSQHNHHRASAIFAFARPGEISHGLQDSQE